MAQRETSKAGHADKIAFVLAVIVSIASALPSRQIEIGSGKFWALLGLGGMLIAFGLIERKPSDLPGAAWRTAGYFALQSLLLAGIFSITRLEGMSVMAAFTIVGEAVACLPAVGAIVVVTSLYVGIVLGGVFFVGTKNVASFAASVFAGFAFVTVFMRVAVREKNARTEAEQLWRN